MPDMTAAQVDDFLGAAAQHYLGNDAAPFLANISQALVAGRRWVGFELSPATTSARIQSLGSPPGHDGAMS